MFVNTAAGSQNTALGEDFQIISEDEDVEEVYLRGIYSDTTTDVLDAEVAISISRPNVLFRDSDTSGQLDREIHKIKRLSTDVIFNIVEAQMDDIGVTLYYVEQE